MVVNRSISTCWCSQLRQLSPRSVQVLHGHLAANMPPKQITRSALVKLAARTARLLSHARGETVLCECWGQPYGPRAHRRYRADPLEWHVPFGQRHSRTPIAFAFNFGGVNAQWEVHVQPCHHAVTSGHATPPCAWSRITLQELEALAEGAAKSMSLELGLSVTCKYLGQPYGPAARRRYRRDPREWRVAAGDWHSHQTIAFAWMRPDLKSQAVTEQRCDNVQHQGLAAPAGWPCTVLWAEVRKELELAAAKAGDEANQIWLEEFGCSLSCR